MKLPLGQRQIGTEHPDFSPNSFEYGDSVKWSGDVYYLSFIARRSFNFVSFFEKEPGRYVRHPIAQYTYNGFGADIRSLSRDQLTGVIAGIIGQRDRAAAWRLVRAHFKRGFLFAWNTIKNGVDPEKAKWKIPDLTGPAIWGMEIRALDLWILKPLLWFLDLWLVLDAAYQTYLDGDDNECISFLITLFIANDHLPTFWSKCALYIVDTDDMEKELTSYWGGWRDHPELIPLYLNKLIGLKSDLYDELGGNDL